MINTRIIKRTILILIVLLLGILFGYQRYFRITGGGAMIEELRSTMSGITIDCEAYLEIHGKLPLGEKHTKDAVTLTNSHEGSAFLTALNEAGPRTYPIPLLDPWKNPYQILLDYDGNHTLQIPSTDIIREDTDYLIWSCGPDGKTGTPETDKDDIYR